VERFGRKRKAPTPRSKYIKISKKDVDIAAEGLLDLGTAETIPPPNRDACVEKMDDKSTQTCETITEDKEQQTVYNKDFLGAKIENILLKNQLKNEAAKNTCAVSDAQLNTSLSLKALKIDNVKMKLFTGLTYEQFCILFNFLGESVHHLTYWDGKEPIKETQRKKMRKLKPEDELFLTLVRLKRGYCLDVLAHFFGISASTVSTIFNTWIQLLYCHFHDMRKDMFPGRDHFKTNLPRIFKSFKNIRCTIDCTEFFVQMLRDLKRQGHLYSSYKNTHTFKCLVAIAPNGSIVFVSALYEGCISDRAVVEQCDFLNYINPGDMVLADCGFTIEDLLNSKQATLNIPPFLGKKEQNLLHRKN
jgi:hypothetical protein